MLYNRSLLEASMGRCSLYTCKHDWMLEYLNHEFGIERCRIVTSTDQRVTEELPISMCELYVQSVYARKQCECISRTIFLNKSPRKETCGHAALLQDFRSLADCIFAVVKASSHAGEIIIAQCLSTPFETDRFLSRLECLAYLSVMSTIHRRSSLCGLWWNLTHEMSCTV